MKKAYETRDVATIQPALENINEIWKTASEEIYKAQAEGQQGAGAEGAEPTGDAGDTTEEANESADVEDVDFEEVK